MKVLESIPPLVLYGLEVLLCITFSVGGVLRAVHLGCPAEGGRGGAIATVIAFLILFSRPDWGLRFFADRNESKGDSSPISLERKVDLLYGALQADSVGRTAQNYALACATITGTLFWGFGDYFAKWLMHSPPHCPCL